MSTTHIIALVKDPECEPVKTRLAAHIGQLYATTLYRMFLEILNEQLARLQLHGLPGVIAHSPHLLSQATAALFPGLKLFYQGSGNIGERLNHIDASLFEDTNTPRIFIGSDAPTLPDNLLMDASLALNTTDSVLAPATDGGFVLIGTRKKLPDLASVPWSQDTTAKATLSALQAGQLSTTLLEPWEDIDDGDSMRRMLAHLRQTKTSLSPAMLKMLGLCEHIFGHDDQIGVVPFAR